jgi:hypothetical protein
LTQFESIGDELRKLRERDTAATLQIKDLERKLSQSEQWVRRLREKVSVLERHPTVLDGIDENWLWDNRAEMTFKRNLDGNRTLEIRSRGRVSARVHHRPGTPGGDHLLRKALNEASGREKK